MSAQTRSEIADLLERHHRRPAHRLGQHFLADANITRKIVSVAGVGSGDQVVEIGAGTGTLTSALADTGARVVAYEIDNGMRPVLEEVLGDRAVDLRFVDVTKIDLRSDLGDGEWVMVANLPYNVGTPLVMEVLRHVPAITRLVVMVQREVAERLVARPGDDAYGLPSVVAGLYSSAKLAFKVPPQVFYPQPKVDSAVVVIERVPADPAAARAVELARAGFSKRRKMLRQALADALEDPVTTLDKAGLSPTTRAEELSEEDYLRLARVSS